MLPSPPFSRLSREQCQKTQICNPRSGNLASIGLIICLLLSNFFNNEESSNGEDAFLGESPQITISTQNADDGKEQRTRATIARVESNNQPSPGDDKPRRRRRKRQCGLSRMGSHPKWRLGFACIRYRGFLFKPSMVGATVKQKSVHTSWNESFLEEKWEKICSSLWNDRNGQRILRSIRLFLSCLSFDNVKVPNLVSICWLNDLKLTIWILCSVEHPSKDQSENLKQAGRNKPPTTMVNTTLKGSVPQKPKEARPCGYKTGIGKIKTEFDMADFIVRLLRAKEIKLHCKEISLYVVELIDPIQHCQESFSGNYKQNFEYLKPVEGLNYAVINYPSLLCDKQLICCQGFIMSKPSLIMLENDEFEVMSAPTHAQLGSRSLMTVCRIILVDHSDWQTDNTRAGKSNTQNGRQFTCILVKLWYSNSAIMNFLLSLEYKCYVTWLSNYTSDIISNNLLPKELRVQVLCRNESSVCIFLYSYYQFVYCMQFYLSTIDFERRYFIHRSLCPKLNNYSRSNRAILLQQAAVAAFGEIGSSGIRKAESEYNQEKSFTCLRGICTPYSLSGEKSGRTQDSQVGRKPICTTSETDIQSKKPTFLLHRATSSELSIV